MYDILSSISKLIAMQLTTGRALELRHHEGISSRYPQRSILIFNDHFSVDCSECTKGCAQKRSGDKCVVRSAGKLAGLADNDVFLSL
jgi:hypothetical protein